MLSGLRGGGVVRLRLWFMMDGWMDGCRVLESLDMKSAAVDVRRHSRTSRLEGDIAPS